jgi:mono/diheme cytochrome c family protein
MPFSFLRGFYFESARRATKKMIVGRSESNMKRLITFAALAIFAAVALPVASSDQAEAATQNQKRKQKGKKKPVAPAAAATGAAATGAATTPAPANAAAAEPAKPAESQNIVKTDLYTVVDGYRVDEKTMNGFRAWRAAACDRCHGANQEGLVGPALTESMKKLTKEEFIVTVRDGRLEKGMQSFGNHEQVMKNIDNLYAYLKGRADGAITKAKVSPLE